MGDRCVIATEKRDIGLYLHWYGDRAYVESFLAYAAIRKIRSPEKDDYGWARLCQIIGNSIGGDLGMGIGPYDTMDRNNGNNGVYIIRDWKIVGREFFDGEETCRPDPDFLMHIDSRQPEDDRVGDTVLMQWMYENGMIRIPKQDTYIPDPRHVPVFGVD